MQILAKISESVTSSEIAPALALLDALVDRYPVFAQGLPLAIGIHAEVLAHWPDVPPETLRVALRRLTRSFQYRAALERKESRRFHLDGSDAGEVSEAHRHPRYPRPPKRWKTNKAPPPEAPKTVTTPLPPVDAPARPIRLNTGPIATITIARREPRP